MTNAPRLDDILTTQVRGGIRTPENAEKLLVRSDKSKWGRNFTQAQRRKQFVSADGKTIYRLKKRGAKAPENSRRGSSSRPGRKKAVNKLDVVGFLRPAVSVPKHFRLGPPIKLIERKLPFYGHRFMREEILKWEQRLK